jgi:hypothetical protein
VEALGYDAKPLLQEMAPGEDFCVAVLARKGELAAMMAYRNLTTFPRKAGAGAVRETVDAEPFRQAVEQVLAAHVLGRPSRAGLPLDRAGRRGPKAHRGQCPVLGRHLPFDPDRRRLSWLLYQQTIGAPLDVVGEPQIGARTKTPGVWLLAAVEDVAATAPQLAAAKDAWREIRRRLSAGELSGLRQHLAAASGRRLGGGDRRTAEDRAGARQERARRIQR